MALVLAITICPITPRVRRFLTDEGVIYLREYLNLPSEIVPATQKKSARPLERGSVPVFLHSVMC